MTLTSVTALVFVLLFSNSNAAQAAGGAKCEFPRPSEVRGIYLTSPAAERTIVRANYIELARRTRINAVVINVNEDGPFLDNMAKAQAVLAEFASACITTIGRINAFRSDKNHPTRSARDQAVYLKTANGVPWAGKSGIRWLDPAAEKNWDMLVGFAKRAHTAGFREIQFDYIRYPNGGDGTTTSINYYGTTNPPLTLKREYLARALDEITRRLRKDLAGVTVSADIFGVPGVTFDGSDPARNGQDVRDFFKYFDVISNMIYPSHWQKGFFGFTIPAENPSGTIHRAMQRPIEYQRAKYPSRLVRPWLQVNSDKVLYTGTTVSYGPGRILEQVIAAEAYTKTWLLWSSHSTEQGGNFSKIAQALAPRMAKAK